jgi:hypothetical protein
LLGVNRNYLAAFWGEHPEFREEYDTGREMRAIKLRAIGDRHASYDPATWRFLAKNELGLSDDPSKTKLQEEAAKQLSSGPDETRARIMELTGKLVGVRNGEETVKANAGAHPQPGAKQAGARRQGHEKGPEGQEIQARPDHHVAGARVDAGSAAKQAAVAKLTNKLMPHAPPRLSGRLGSK